jgi:hypothetical protein
MLRERLFKDGVLTIDEAHEILSPYYSDIMGCINEGLNSVGALRLKEPEFYIPLTPRSRASIIHDHIEAAAKRAFGIKNKDIAVYTEKGFLVVDFYERVFLRFKKLQHNLMPCNIETEQQKAFDEQTLFGGPVTHVTAGYRLNDSGIYRDAHVVCWSCGELLWSLRLPDIEVGERSDIAVTPNIAPSSVVVRKSAASKVGTVS